jgi:type IX secretion system PorP/SprF family membrane protein
MLRKVLILSMIFTLHVCTLPGQTNTKISLAYPVYSQYLHNGLIINPGYAGTREALSFFASARYQWMGIDGSPEFYTASLHTMLKNEKVGLGFTGQYMKYGATSSFSAFMQYAYHIRVGKGKLGMGLKGGLDYSNTNYGDLNPIQGGDPAFADSKPYILPNVGAGLYYYSKKFFLGAAIPSFLSYVSKSGGETAFNSFLEFDVQATAGLLLTFSSALKFKPSVFIDYSLDKTKEMRIDINGNFIIYDMVWIGGSWRTSENVAVGIVQVQVSPQLMVGSSYDFPMGSMDNSKGSFEFVFRYEFGKKISAANPRYF